MSPIETAIAQALPPNMEPAERDAVLAAASVLPVDRLMTFLMAAQEAKTLLDAGLSSEARARVDELRPMAIDAGLEPLFDQMVATIFPE